MSRRVKATVLALSCITMIAGIWYLVATMNFSPVVQESTLQQKYEKSGVVPYESKDGSLNIEEINFSFGHHVINFDFVGSYKRFGRLLTLEGGGTVEQPELRGFAVHVIPQEISIEKVYFDGELLTDERAAEIFATKVATTKPKLADKAKEFASRFGFKGVEKVTDAVSDTLAQNRHEILSEVKEGAKTLVNVAAREILDRVPVYTIPKDKKGVMAVAFFESMDIQPGTLTIHLSLISGLMTLLGIVLPFLVAVAMIVLIIRHPHAAEHVLNGITAAGDAVQVASFGD